MKKNKGKIDARKRPEERPEEIRPQLQRVLDDIERLANRFEELGFEAQAEQLDDAYDSLESLQYSVVALYDVAAAEAM